MFNSTNLGWWHTMKHAALTIWKKFASFLLAPLWHHLYPTSQFHIKPGSLPCVLAHLVILHLAYPAIRANLLRLSTNPTSKMNERLKNAVQDLTFLFEFAIPVVRLTGCVWCVWRGVRGG